jgi:hypothetical protein
LEVWLWEVIRFRGGNEGEIHDGIGSLFKDRLELIFHHAKIK